MTCHIIPKMFKKMFIRFIVLMEIFISIFSIKAQDMSMHTSNLCWLFLISIMNFYLTNVEKTHHTLAPQAKSTITHHLTIEENISNQKAQHLSFPASHHSSTATYKTLFYLSIYAQEYRFG